MSDRQTGAHEDGRALRVASAVSVLATVALPALLSLVGLAMGVATSNLGLVIAAVVVGMLATYGWIRRVRVNGSK